MTLASSMFPDLPDNHVIGDCRGWLTKADQNYTIREVTCEHCGELLAAIVAPIGHNCDLVWPFRIYCEGKDGHRLVARAKDEDAHGTVKGRAVPEEEAKEFLRRFVDDGKR